jgi:hypothetical protein
MQRLLHLNRGFAEAACLRFKYNAAPEIQGEISPRIKCSNLRFKCNSLLHLNRGLPGSAVYDLSTVRQNGSPKGAFDRYENLRTQSHACLRPILNLSVLYCPFRVVTRNTTVEEMAGVFPLAIRDAIYRAIA